MSEHFDEYCDSNNPKPIKLDDILKAVDTLRPHIAYTPCQRSNHQIEFAMQLYYKLETLQPTGSFKERGALNALQLLSEDKKKKGVVVASLGNAGLGMSYHASKLQIPVVVVMPTTVPIAKRHKCHILGADVIVKGANLVEAQSHAQIVAKSRGLTYINGRDHPHVLAGYGTIGLEILEQVPHADAVIVPVGSGGLAAAVATVIKTVKPSCLVYGVQAETMPAIFKSLAQNSRSTIAMQPTLADGIALTQVGVNSYHNIQSVINKMLLVNEDWIARAMVHLVEDERLVVEGAGACPLAAIIGELVPELRLKRVVCVLSGGNVDTMLLTRCLDRGLAAEGRLMKFKVRINDNSCAQAQLLATLANAGYNVVEQFQEHRWLDDSDDTYRFEIKLVVRTRGLEHALQLESLMEREYPNTVFETKPFKDKRTCACFARNTMK